MELSKLISKFWGELFPNTVIHLSTYRLERSRKYPGVKGGYFNPLKMSWFNYKKSLLEETTKATRKAHNDRVLKNFRDSQTPKGS